MVKFYSSTLVKLFVHNVVRVIVVVVVLFVALTFVAVFSGSYFFAII